MMNVYVLSDSSEVVGVYESMEKVKQAVHDYMLALQTNDIDAFDEFVTCSDEPFVFTVRKIPMNGNPAWFPYLLEKNVKFTKAYVTWDSDENTFNVEYRIKIIVKLIVDKQ